jgi:SNF2 family DNA or RNA helicase
MVEGLSWQGFEDKYCRVNIFQAGKNYRPIRQIEGTKPEKVPVIRRMLTPVMSILKTDDVIKEIPPLRVSNYPLMMSDLEKKCRATTLLKQMDARLSAVFDKGGDFLSNLAQAELAFATERRAIGMAKAPWIAQLVNEELTTAPHKKIVIFGFHRDVLQTLCELLDTFGVVRVDGGVGTKAKQEAQDRFQTDPNIRVFIGQIKAASTNLTLTAAHDVILAEASWNPGDNYQAIRRCRRIGQTRPVLARYISMSGADDRINRVLAERSMELDTLFATGSADE